MTAHRDPELGGAKRSQPLGPALLLVAAALAAACAREPPLPPARLELAAFAAAARVAVETAQIDVGTPAARERLELGWGPDETSGEMSFAWGAGSASTLLFERVRAGAVELQARGWSYPFDDGQGQTVTFRLNGEAIGERRLGLAPESFALTLPARWLVAGENRLELSYRRFFEQGRKPHWAAGWDGFRFAAGPAPAAPAIDAAAGRVTLPAGSAVEWTLELPAGSWLAWDDVATRGAARLAIAAREESAGERERETTSSRGAGRLALAAPDGDGGLVGFALRALGADGEVTLSGLRLHTPLAAAAAASPPRPADAARPNLVVYLIDTLRADHLGCYGYPRPTSPVIDRLAGEGVRVVDSRAQSSWTKPGVASVLTGLFPSQHGAELRAERIPERIELLSERLTAAGYQTALFTTNANITKRFGFDQGWEEFHYLAHKRSGGRWEHYSSAEIHREVVGWLERRDPARPFFLFVHTLDPHDPYRPAEPFRARLAPEVDVERACCARSNVLRALDPAAARARARDAALLYDAEIAENDAAFGELLGELARRGLDAATAVLLTSDHGEEFYEHGGWKHGFTLYEEQLRVPFVLRLPGRAHAGTVVDGPVDQIDVVPTFLDLAGLPATPELPGRSLLAALAGGGERAAARPSFARLERPGLELVAAEARSFKLIRARGEWTPPAGRPPVELYDLARDPGEGLDLARERTLRRPFLESLLRLHERALGPAAAPETTPIDPDTERTLRALGYI